MSEAEELLRRLAEKLVEPMNSEVDGKKTIGEWRKEIAALHSEVIDFERCRLAVEKE